MKESLYDVCVIGHITKDIIKIGNIKKEIPGGSAYYVSIALKTLGLKPFVITKLSENDKYLFDELRKHQIPFILRKSKNTTIFENIYKKDVRIQKVTSVASPFEIKDLPNIKVRMFYLGPLTKNDFSLEIFEHLGSSGYRVALDVQGFLRKIDKNEVKMEKWGKKEVFSYVEILHADEIESRILSEEEDVEKAAKKLAQFGPKEVIITLGKKGSFIFAKGKSFFIPPLKTKVVDPTGCGDTYMASYIYKRLTSSEDFYEIGRFCTKITSIKLKRFGPFNSWD